MGDWLTNINTFFSDLGVIGVILGAIIGWLLNWRINQSRINADLKAKTRLEWIREIRELTATIIEEHNHYLKLMHKYNEKYEKLSKHSYNQTKLKNKQEKLLDEFNDLSRDLIADTSKNRNLYKLYFARITKRKWYDPKRLCNLYEEEHKDNNVMHDFVDKVYSQIYDSEKFFLTHGKIDGSILKNDVIINFRNETSNYLKKEWDKAKRNR